MAGVTDGESERNARGRELVRQLKLMNGGKAASRLVVVSNRVPAAGMTPGGLAVALKDALTDRESLWFGWSGAISETSGEEVRTVKHGGTTYALTDLTQAEYDGYYAGYSNRALWPAFHYRLDLGVFDDSDFAAYRRVNSRFARQLAALLRPDDLIWIHDYHLLLFGSALREQGVQNPIGFFSHIPFPSPELFQAIPQHRELAAGLMACNLIGFQSRRDRANFERYIVERANGIFLPDGRLDAFGHLARAAAFPIGIDVESFGRAANLRTGGLTQRLAAASGDHAVILGVDRMDYSKGLPERLLAVEEMFNRHPDLRGRATLVQITPVSRSKVKAYAELRQQIETLIGRINGEFAQIDWTPVHYMAQGVNRDDLAGLLRLARVGLVTPLRDGMNLVAKEYVAAQDPEDPGVLVLSEFAGASEQLSGGALIVNPYDTVQQAEAIHRALHLPLPERRERHAAMMQVLRECDSRWWCNAFLKQLEGARAQGGSDDIRTALNLFGNDRRAPGKVVGWDSP